MEGLDISPPTTTGAPAKVLLVEDDPALRELLQNGLSTDHICLSTAASAREAFTFIDENPIDLLILDLGLPELDGYAVLNALQHRVSDSLLPVIILTARQNTEDKLRSFELGAMDYVTKPFDLLELRARVRATLRTKRLHDALLQTNRRLNQARIAAEDAARSKAAFLASMSHEIRTPMNGVIAMTGLLMESELRHEQREFVDTIRTSGESLLGIIDDILNISKIEAGKLELEHRPLQLQLCIEEALDILGAKAGEKRLDLMYEIDDHTPPRVVGDVTRLRQIFVNLVGNAIKFTSKGEIAIEVQSKGRAGIGSPQGPQHAADSAGKSDSPQQAANSRHEVQFTVRDTGIGIPQNKINRLFHSYSQADSSTTRHYGGTGLGLAISKALVELMGGKIWVESKEGVGSSFHFTLPLEAVPQTAAGTSSATPAPSAHGKILIVDDNPSHCRALSKLVQKWGFQTSHAVTVQDGLAQVQADKYDFVMLDLQMPDLPQGQPCDQFAAHSPRIIGMTGVGTLTEDYTAGLAGSVTKPVKSSQLHNLLFQSQANAPAPLKPASPNKLDTSLSAQIPLRVLLVDDNVINQKVASRLLQQLGYKVDLANNGLEAIQALEKKPYDVVFMDVQMPILDGLEATRRIRQRQAEPSAPETLKQPIYIIAMTANAMQGDREKCIAAGMNDYLSKPVRPEALQSAIKRIKPPGQNSPQPAIPAAPKPAATILRAPVVDIDRLIEFSGGNQDNFNELVTLYLDQTAQQIATLRNALQIATAGNNTQPSATTDNDTQASATIRIARISHSCAGASSTCGMLAIVPFLRKLEYSANDGDLSAAPQLIEDIAAEFAQIRTFLEDYQKSAAAAPQLKAI